MTHATLQFVDTPDGPFAILADDADRVIVSGWTADAEAVLARLRPDRRPIDVTAGETSAADAVRAYYAGDVAAIDAVAVAQSGTTLQLAGWNALRGIRPGSPLTYAGFASALGSPTAVRAAASICARNAVALFVPCHRVLRGDGTMGGFAWGTGVKRSLLARESAV
ncbi:methylated-DNA-[protein]-cysteine S-methyltransferase [Microbacterium sp. SORGH_AS 1204]|uniref:methylated-DNA--[protein]-cysteine S-methyltransferase n=1 Tax=Microbacterium sp. SORGH_AS_1204 TaxID=3041785 RepID=UPI00278DA229|nr:methylated-DNA--[protein]-cysteine S-methyltransferase [Microbacterium sp. SORGH_AS_1204]MDQ1137714.1 methylated-DNA-[protein]-cysteine S-methyltransferase [Microbacterium sp. SORGH_AS_1204]